MPVRIAVIGLGWWGRKMIAVLQKARDEIEIVRAVEPDLEAVAAFAEQNSLTVTAGYGDALSDRRVEAVILATPHALHESQVAQAVAAGKHVFCEKPPSMTSKEMLEVIEAEKRTGKILKYGFC